MFATTAKIPARKTLSVMNEAEQRGQHGMTDHFRMSSGAGVSTAGVSRAGVSRAAVFPLSLRQVQ